MYDDNPEFFAVRFSSDLHERRVAESLFNDSETESAVLLDRDDIVAYFFDKDKADQIEARLNLGRVAYETMKEVANAADGTSPYSNSELIDILLPVLNSMYKAGVRGQGEK